MADDLQDRLDEQLRYYRARAPEYDAWALREGGFARGPRERAKWFADIAKLERALDRFHPSGRVLELACGTGQWTERLTRYADRLTAVDAAEEALDLNRRRVGDGVRYIHADMFSWEPAETYDVVFFSFWLSHVPPERFGRHIIVKIQVLGNPGQLRESGRTFGTSIRPKCQHICQAHTTMPPRPGERHLASVQQFHKRRPAHTEQLSSLLRRQRGVQRCDGDRFALGQRERHQTKTLDHLGRQSHHLPLPRTQHRRPVHRGHGVQEPAQRLQLIRMLR